MLLPYLQNLLSRRNLFKQLLLIFFVINSNLVHSQTLYQTLETSFEKSKESYSSIIKKHLNRNFNFKNVEDVNNIKLNNIFLNSLLFYNKNKVLNFALQDKCAIVDLLGTDLLYGPNGKLEYVLFSFKNKKGLIENHALKKSIYLNRIGYVQCPQSKKFAQYFQIRNLRNTLKTIRFKYPQSQQECNSMFDSFITAPTSPYICDIVKKIEEFPRKNVMFKNMSRSNFRKYEALKKEIDTVQSYKKIFKSESFFYFRKLCHNAGAKDLYCESLFNINFWNNSFNDPSIGKAFEYYCTIYHKGKKLTESRMRKCVNLFNQSPDICHYMGNKDESLFPKPDCNELSRALNFSRIKQDYNDCPARVGNNSLISVGRLLNHLDSSKKSENLSCESYSTQKFVEFNKEFLDYKNWQMEICFDDKIQKKEVCYPTLLNVIPDSELSIDKTVGKVLARLKGFRNQTQQCKVIYEEEYRPNLLEFKTGCYIIKKKDGCTATKCDFRIVYDDLEFNKFRFKSNMWFDILPFRYTEENKSLISLLERHKKSKVRNIMNMSTFKTVFNKNSKAIFLGVGCAENLLPTFFKSAQLNKCTQTAFTVDGMIEDQGHYALITRTSFDQIHAPRIIPWTYIFSAIKNYQKQHPLKQWSFYAIY